MGKYAYLNLTQKMIKIRKMVPKLLRKRFFTLPKPASEQKMNSLQSKSFITFVSNGFSVSCSF